MAGATSSAMYTRTGIRIVSCAILLVLLWSSADLVVTTIASWSSDNNVDTVGNVLLPALHPLWVEVFVVVSACALAALGYLALHLGRDEFGPRHVWNLTFSLLALLAAGAVLILSGYLVLFASFAEEPESLGPSPQYIQALTFSASLNVLSAILLGLFLRWNIVVFLTRWTRRWSFVALTLGVAGSLVAGFATIAVRSGALAVAATDVWALVSVAPDILGKPLAVASLGLWAAIYEGVVAGFRRERRQTTSGRILAEAPNV